MISHHVSFLQARRLRMLLQAVVDEKKEGKLGAQCESLVQLAEPGDAFSAFTASMNASAVAQTMKSIEGKFGLKVGFCARISTLLKALGARQSLFPFLPHLQLSCQFIWLRLLQPELLICTICDIILKNMNFVSMLNRIVISPHFVLFSSAGISTRTHCFCW